MLELDAALLAFLEDEYSQAGTAVQQSFEELLDMEDADILDLLMGRRSPQSPAQARLVATLTGPGARS